MFKGIYQTVQRVRKAVVFTGGCMSENMHVDISEDDYIICADKGIKYCDSIGCKADLWVGDFDSSDYEECILLSAASRAEVIRLNPVKDDTDTEFALDCAVKKGYENILLLGGIGSRIDHSLANVFLLEKYLKQGVTVTIADDKNIIHIVADSTIEICKSDMKYVSILPLDDVRVSNRGFLYPLQDKVMHRYSSLGISNELVSENGTIDISGGTAIVIESKD